MTDMSISYRRLLKPKKCHKTTEVFIVVLAIEKEVLSLTKNSFSFSLTEKNTALMLIIGNNSFPHPCAYRSFSRRLTFSMVDGNRWHFMRNTQKQTDRSSILALYSAHVRLQAGSAHQRSSQIHFLAGCRKTRLNRALSVICLMLVFFWTCFIFLLGPPTLIVFGYFLFFICFFSWLLWFLLFVSTPFPSLPLPFLDSAAVSWERCELPQRGLGRNPSQIWIWYI